MTNVFDVIERQRTSAPDRIAIRSAAKDYTYAELCRKALHAADRLTELGVQRSGRVVLAAPSVPEFVMTYFGIQALGATIIPVNPLSSAAEVEFILKDSEPQAVVHWMDSAPGVVQAATDMGLPMWNLGPAEEVKDNPKAGPVERQADEHAAILYTSGTTGQPKGVVLSIANVMAAGEICAELSEGDANERIATALPLFHVFGQSSVMMMALTLGGSLTLLPRFEPKAMLDTIKDEKISIVCGVPTMWNAMVHTDGDYRPEDFQALRIAVSGGSPLAPAIAETFQKRFGCVLLDGYGLTESTSIATFSRLDRPRPEGFTGPAAPRIQVKVFDGESDELEPGDVGEVLIKSPTVMLEYLNQKEATAEAFTSDGWLRTGDLGLFNDQGDLRIVDRSKELIIQGGYNVYPAEVEAVLMGHSEVLEVAVLGKADTGLGERGHAVVVRAPQSQVTAQELSAWLSERLIYYKVPTYFTFVDSLPKGNTGKILKRKINVEDLNLERVRHTGARSVEPGLGPQLGEA